ncbi:hypothetical protein [Vitreoscilla stercoraria]|uniref:Uncharacterized protein n=1 Tax=Vitreoscilla stercoraria TaxID=61 RepID=A0ABY4EDQ2_VITST|nr:hypothetical protein [Vitreoscilla stercoraria]UOO93349.1 hypothetical protein LVJ81_04795 [Vitreoscilla stercoraria]
MNEERQFHLACRACSLSDEDARSFNGNINELVQLEFGVTFEDFRNVALSVMPLLANWFYVADGDFPPNDEDVLAWNIEINKAVVVKSSIFKKQHTRTQKLGIKTPYPCWQPIVTPIKP